MRVDELALALGASCPSTIGYIASVDDAYDLVLGSRRIDFGEMPLEPFEGKQAVIRLEVVGVSRESAVVEKRVTLTVPPPGPPP
jgi:hypothetical protein